MRASRYVFGLVLAAACVVWTADASAQTSGVGPYLATPSWDQTLGPRGRFLVLTNMGSAAVLDNETGLVWERSPDPPTVIWFYAMNSCTQKAIGGRKGWRLPNVYELSTLIDPSITGPGPVLPAGHPFTGFVALGPGAFFWTSTPVSDPPLLAWAMTFAVQDGAASYVKDTFQFRAWCVRSATSQVQ